MSNLSELLPSGGGQNVVEFTADGAISAGDAVALQTDGTVTGISSTGNPAAIGAAQVYETGNAYYKGITSAGTNKVVVFYADGNNGSYPTCAVGTVSSTDNTVTWATPVVVESSAVGDELDLTYSPTDSVVIFVWSTSTFGRIRKASLSGTSLTFGTAVNLTGSGVASNLKITMAETENYAIVVYRRSASSGYGYYRNQECGNGTTVSQASETAFKSANVTSLDVIASSTLGDVLICYRIVSTATGQLIASGLPGSYSTSFSFSGETQFSTVTPEAQLSGFNESLDRAVVYFAESTSGHYARVVGTNAGASVTLYGSNTSVASTTYNSPLMASIDTDNNTLFFGYCDSANSNYGTYRLATMTTTSITFTGSNLVTDFAITTTTNDSAVAYNSQTGKFVVAVRAASGSQGTSNVVAPASSNVADFIGLASAAISDTASGDINVKGGINEAQTGLTIGSDYYVQDDGTLSTTSSSVKVGQAITATTINMMDLT